jgi:hypothetical protein
LKARPPGRCTITTIVIYIFTWAAAVWLSVEGTEAIVVAVAVGNVDAVSVGIGIVEDLIVWRIRDIECTVGTYVLSW